MMLPYLSTQDLRSTLPYPALIAAMREAFRCGIRAPVRHAHTISEQGPTTMLLMPAWAPGAAAGVKLVTVSPGNPRRHLPTVHSIYLLLDTVTGVPLAMLDGEELTLRRTAAASALASSYLSRPASSKLLVIGTGRLAPYMAAAHCTARPICSILVWGRSRAKAEHAVQEMQAQGVAPEVRIDITENLQDAAQAADIISCATTSTTPVLHGEMVRPGTHVDLVGGFRPDMREADDALMARSAIFVDTFAGALAEAGDLLQPMATGSLQRDAIVAELADLAAGRHAGRNGEQQVTVFKSVGTAIEDLCAAQLAWTSFSNVNNQ